MIEGEHLVTLTSDKLIIKVVQVPCQLQDQTWPPPVSPTPLLYQLLSVSCWESLEICTSVCIFSLGWNQWKECVSSDLFRGEINEQVDWRIVRKMDKKMTPIFPGVYFLLVNKRQMISEKEVWLYVLISFGSICAIFEEWKCVHLFFIIRSGGTDGPFWILITCWHIIWAYDVRKKQTLFYSCFSSFSSALSGLTGK